MLQTLPADAQRRFHPGIVVAIVAAIALLGWLAIFIATRQGPGIEGDSVSYISTARSILAGNGVRTISDDGEWRPLISFPPLFPGLLAALTPRGGEVIVTARHVNAGLCAITLALAGALLWRSTRSLTATTIALLALLASVPQLRQYQRVFTEPLFNATILASLLLLSFYGQSKRREWLILAVILAAASCFARYAGMSMLGVGVALVVLYRRPRWKPAVLDSLIFGVVAITPILLWLLRNLRLSKDGTATGRYGKWHPPGLEQWQDMAGTFADWVLPPVKSLATLIDIAAVMGVVAAVAYGIYTVAPMLRSGQAGVDETHVSTRRCTLAAMVAFVVVYLPFLVYVRSYVDAGMPFNARILSPLFVPLVVIAAAGSVAAGRMIGREGGMALAAIAAVLVCINAAAARLWLNKTVGEGQGYLSKKWQQSKTIAHVRTLSTDGVIYSNGWDAIYILTDRVVRSSPRMTFRTSEKRNDKIRAEVGVMLHDLEQRGGFAVYFDKRFIDRDDFLFRESDFKEWMKRERTVYDEPNDGRIYRVGKKKLTTAESATRIAE